MRFSKGYFNDIDNSLESILCLDLFSNSVIAVTGASRMIGSVIMDLLLRLKINSNITGELKVLEKTLNDSVCCYILYV